MEGVDAIVPELVCNVLTIGILAGRVRRLKKLAEIVDRDDLAKTLQGILEELKWSEETDLTEVDPELLKDLRNRFAKTSSSLDL